MATKLYDCMIATSKYQDRNGQEKRKWENVGAIWRDKDNNGNIYEYLMLKRIFNPAGIETREGADAVRISLFKPQPKQQQLQARQQQGQSVNGNFNNIPSFDDFGEPISSVPF